MQSQISTIKINGVQKILYCKFRLSSFVFCFSLLLIRSFFVWSDLYYVERNKSTKQDGTKKNLQEKNPDRIETNILCVYWCSWTNAKIDIKTR